MRTPLEPGEHTLTIEVGGYRRGYLLHVPALRSKSGAAGMPEDADDPPDGLPLLLFFHGGGGNARLAVLTTGWSEKADKAGFFVVYPQALRPEPHRPPTFLRNPQFWNVGSGLGYAEANNVDDTAFVAALLDHLCDRLPIDPRRVYASGFSNGAAFTFCLAMELSGRFAAIGPVSGYPWRQTPRPRHPHSVIYISGTADPMNPLDGSPIDSPWGRLPQRPPVGDAIRKWALWTGCPRESRVLRDDGEVRRLRYGPGEQGAEVDLITINGAGHAWPGGPPVLAERLAGKPTDKLNATDVIWEFFQQHPEA
jgi:polyhydroxybutyrate depolymerase